VQVKDASKAFQQQVASIKAADSLMLMAHWRPLVRRPAAVQGSSPRRGGARLEVVPLAHVRAARGAGAAAWQCGSGGSAASSCPGGAARTWRG
jgi:hypothetical protein